MVKRTVTAIEEPGEGKSYELPSEREHLFQIVDVYDSHNNPFEKGIPEDYVAVVSEVVGGEEEGRNLLTRIPLLPKEKGFFATQLLLKVIGLSYKGETLVIDTEEWIGKQYYATVKHNKGFASIDRYNFDKMVENKSISVEKKGQETIAWDD